MLKEETRDRIYRAAVAVMSGTGFYSATTDKIAEVAGVSIGTVYNYFRSKDEILAYIFEVELHRRQEAIQHVRRLEVDSFEKLRLVILANARQVQKEPHLSRLLWGERGLGRGQAAVRRFLVGVTEQFQALLDDGMAVGDVRPCDPHLAARLVLASVESVLAEIILDGEGSGRAAEAERRVAELVALLWRGLGNYEVDARPGAVPRGKETRHDDTA